MTAEAKACVDKEMKRRWREIERMHPLERTSLLGDLEGEALSDILALKVNKHEMEKELAEKACKSDNLDIRRSIDTLTT
jgi:hypothetical protein